MVAKAKILVIDDSRTVLIATRHVLELAGYEVLTLDSAVGAIGKIRREHPNLVLLDLSMPECDGEQLLNIISGFGSLPDTKILLHSDQDVRILERVTIRAGAHGFIQKTSPEKLVLQVDKWLRDNPFE